MRGDASRVLRGGVTAVIVRQRRLEGDGGVHLGGHGFEGHREEASDRVAPLRGTGRVPRELRRWLHETDATRPGAAGVWGGRAGKRNRTPPAG